MKLRRLRILDFEGLKRPLELELRGGLVLIYGPNGSGKSSLCRALRTVLWPGRGRGRVDVVFEREGGEELEASLDGGAVRWRSKGGTIEPPQLPSVEYGACYFLGIRSLLEDRSGDDQALAASVRRQMAGGVDLVKLLESKAYLARPKLVEKKRKEVDAQRRKKVAVEHELQALAVKEDGLAQLRRELQEAEQEGARLPLYAKARRRVELLERVGELREKLASFPESTAFLKGDELARLERIEGELEAQRRRREEAEEALEDARRRMEDNALPEVALGEGVLPMLRGEAVRLLEMEKELREAGQEWEARFRALEQTVAEMGGEGLVSKSLRGLELLGTKADALEELLKASEELFEEDAKLGVQRRWWEQQKKKLLGRGGKAPFEAKKIRRGLDGLERALTWSPLNPWTLLLTLGIEGALLLSLPLWVGLAFGALVVLGFGVERGMRLRGIQRDGWGEVLDGKGLSNNPLEAFEQLQAELRRRERWEDASKALEDLDLREEALGARAEELEAEAEALRKAMGLDPEAGRLRLVDWGQRLVDLRRGKEELRLAGERKEARGRAFEELRRALVEKLTAFSGEGLSSHVGGEECVVLVERLGETCAALKRARGDAKQAKARLEDALGALDRAMEDRRVLYGEARLAVQDREALEESAGALPEYRREKKAMESAEAELETLESALAQEPGLWTRDADLVDRWVEGARDANVRAGELHQEIGRVEGEIERTKADQKLAHAMDDWERAQAELRQVSEEEVGKALARGILRSVLEESAAQVETPVFEKAKELFSKFTRGKYELRLKPADGRGEGDVFFAWDREEGVSRSLRELSDGTRSQLLLAARVAFATVEERGLSLPIFLDEALSHADDSRLQAIVEALLGLVQEGRQVVLLTADKADVSRVREQAKEGGAEEVFELIRLPEHIGVPSEGEPAYHIPTIHDIPSPEGLTPSAYAALLRVPAVSLYDPPGSLHLYYLLSDNLPLLHTLLLKGYTTAAQLASPPKGDTHVLQARCALWERFWALWAERRPRPVTRQVLMGSPLASSTFLPKVLELIPDTGILYPDLRDGVGRISGLRRKSKEELDEWAQAEGFFFVDPPLSDDEILRHLLDDSPTSSPLSLEENHALVRLFLAGFKEPLEQSERG